MNLLYLNQDVLFIATSFLSVTDLLHFCETCRSAYALAVEHAYSSVVLDHSPSQVLKFCSSLLSAPHRPLWLRKLRICMVKYEDLAEPSTAYSTLLATLLERALRLRSLSIDNWVQQFAILATAWDNGCASLPLRFRTDLRIPTVRTLHIDTSMLSMTLTAQIFPNVTELSLCNAVNTRTNYVHEEGCWSSLDHVDYAGVGVYTWQLPCPIRWMGFWGINDWVVPKLLALLERASPRIVSISVTTSHFDHPGFWNPLIAITSQLRYLELALTDIVSGNISYWVEIIAPSLQKCTAIGVFIYIPVHNRIGSDEGNSIDTMTAVAKALSKSLCLRYIGVALVQDKDINLWDSAVDYERNAVSWWRVVRTAGGDINELQSITVEQGERARRYLLDANYDSLSALDGLSAI
ncbi:hypothetical protein A0H81_10859 [Grifola frondosa]|uniref:F-box domain-containing protein n=1 Tax=Grifola frondosa TaxID=5627 RepID=A0A1C7LXZ3_GRIFR|nr:hypothetical protein A0H81_10859 [Grifola frondosa]